MVELAAEVVQVITSSAQNPESVPEPDQLRHSLKHQHYAHAAHAAPAPSQSDKAPITQTAEQSTASAQGHCTGRNADTKAGQLPALPLDGTQRQAAPEEHASLQGTRRDTESLAAPSAEHGRPRVSSLQPKVIPSLTFGSQKSSSLFRQPVKSSPTLTAAPVPAGATLPPSQECPASKIVAAPASAPADSAGKVSAEAALAATGGALATAAEPDHPAASRRAVTIALDTSEATTLRPAFQGALAGPGTQSLLGQSQPTALGSMFGASKRARCGLSTARLGVLSNSQQPARVSDHVSFAFEGPMMTAA